MKKAILLMILLMTPTAAASININVPAQIGVGEPSGINSQLDPALHTGTEVWTNQQTQTYSFVLPTSVFNYSAPEGQNDSIGWTWIKAGIASGQPLRITQSTHFAITYNWNSTQSLKLSYDYTKNGWDGLARWSPYYTIEQNGVRLCSNDGSTQVPFTFQQGQVGTNQILGPIPQGSAPYNFFYHSAANFISLLGNSITISPEAGFFTQEDNVSTNGTAQGLTPINSFTQWRNFHVKYSLEDGIYSGICRNPATAAFSFNYTTLTSPISVTIESNNPTLVTQFVGYQFGTFGEVNTLLVNSTSSAACLVNPISNGITQANCVVGQAQRCATSGFSFSIIAQFVCFTTETITGLIGFVFSFVGGFVGVLLDLSPVGRQIHAIVTPIIQFFWDIGSTLLDIYFLPGPNYPVGGTWIALLFWFATFGIGLATFTGDWSFASRTPAWFLKFSTVGVVYGFYWLFWTLPSAAINYLINLFRAVRG